MKELNWNDVVIQKDGTYQTLDELTSKKIENTETFTGTYWVNGSKIYCRHLSGNVGTVTSAIAIQIFLFDEKIIPINAAGYLMLQNGNLRIVNGETNLGGIVQVASDKRNVSLYVTQSSSNADYSIALYYIKED